MKPLQVFIALDQLANTLLGGWADETLSSRAYRRSQKGKHGARRIIDGLFFWQVEHCKNAYYSEINRRQYPADFRDRVRDL